MLALPLPLAALAAAPPVFVLAGPARRLGGIFEADPRVAGAVIVLVAVAAALFLVRRVRRAVGLRGGAPDERTPGRRGAPR